VDFETCDAARLRRDKPFDGLFFAAVRTTRIYCRPICPARPAATRNVSFLPSAPAAEAAGYRPCLRCRPEVALWCPAWKGTRSTVERALKLIEQGALDRGTASELPRASASGRDTSRACSGSISTPRPSRWQRLCACAARSGFCPTRSCPSTRWPSRRALAACGASTRSSRRSTTGRPLRSGARSPRLEPIDVRKRRALHAHLPVDLSP